MCNDKPDLVNILLFSILIIALFSSVMFCYLSYASNEKMQSLIRQRIELEILKERLELEKKHDENYRLMQNL